MIDYEAFKSIRKGAIESIGTASDGEKIEGKWKKGVFIFIFYILPLGGTLTPWLLNVCLLKFGSFITVAISIFTGLFFSLLLNISAKIRIEKENENIDNSNFEEYKENMKQISNITQYVILLGVLIMFLIMFNYLLNFQNRIVEHIIASIVIFILTRYFSCIFFMLQRFHFVLRDEIDNVM